MSLFTTAKAREGMNAAYGAFQPATPDIIPGPPPDTGNRVRARQY